MKKFALFSIINALGILFSTSVWAQIEVVDPYARATPPTATTSAIFMTLKNTGSDNVELIQATASIAGNVELHDMILQGDVMKMRQVQHITIPAHGQTELRPGGLHIMLFDLNGPLKEKESVAVELFFSDQHSVRLTAPIKKVMNGMQMGQKQH